MMHITHEYITVFSERKQMVSNGDVSVKTMKLKQQQVGFDMVRPSKYMEIEVGFDHQNMGRFLAWWTPQIIQATVVILTVPMGLRRSRWSVVGPGPKPLGDGHIISIFRRDFSG